MQKKINKNITGSETQTLKNSSKDIDSWKSIYTRIKRLYMNNLQNKKFRNTIIKSIIYSLISTTIISVYIGYTYTPIVFFVSLLLLNTYYRNNNLLNSFGSFNLGLIGSSIFTFHIISLSVGKTSTLILISHIIIFMTLGMKIFVIWSNIRNN